MKRIMLFLGTNLAIIVVLSITLRILGVERILDEQGAGLNFNALLIFAAVFGFGGSFISLAISKWMAKKTMNVHVIEKPRNATEQWLFDTVRRQAREAGIGMPEVGIYDSPDPNAFATGMSRNNALVAVSTGLMQNMGQGEVEAVLGHEVGHVANGDMVTLALIQGVVNTFVIFLARVIGHFVDRVVFKNEQGHGPAFWITTIVAEILLAILAFAIFVPLGLFAAGTASQGIDLGSDTVVPAEVSDIDGATFTRDAGDITYDLTGLDFGGADADMSVQLGAGTLLIEVPDDVTVTVDAQVGAGEIELFGERRDGINLNENATSSGTGSGTLDLDLDVTVGELEVSRG